MKITLIIIFIIIGVYLILPAPAFPPPPPGSIQSTEPADTESIYRRAYYSNLSRSEVMAFYQRQFFLFPQIVLNHPPEEAYSLIRDQTRSSWLEQLVHPWRETLYINGFYPVKPTEQININGTRYLNKITLHYFPSHPATRLTVLLLAVAGGYWLLQEYRHV